MDPQRIDDVRARMLKAIDNCGSNVQGIILSGGLDTCILAEAGAEKLGLKYAITVLTSPAATDAPYAAAIAEKLGLEHIVIEYPSPMDLIRDTEVMGLTVSALTTFDPMELRNSVVITRALTECKRRGITSVITGDGADELFAGYSYMRGMEGPKLLEYIRHLTTIWRFSAKPLGIHLGVHVQQPFMDPGMVEFALGCTRGELIGEHNGGMHGKYCLRLAFPHVHSAWRGKDPIEVGSGTTALPRLFAAESTKSVFEAEVKDIQTTYKIHIRDPEHLAYFRMFERLYFAPDQEAAKHILQQPPARDGDDPCKDCGYQLYTKDSMFCRTCGAYPARAAVPQESS